MNKFEEIYTQYSNTIFRFCMLRVNNKETAEDITAETFTKVYKYGLEKVENPKAFLFQVARNLIYDHYASKNLKILILRKLKLKTQLIWKTKFYKKI